MIRRARLLTVLGTLLAGAIGVIGSTQTWITVILADGAGEELVVAGAAAVPVLTPLSLATLALGAALSITGLVLRYVFGVLSIAIGAILGVLSAQVAVAPPVSAVAATVTSATGIGGADAVADLVASTTSTPWPALTAIAQVVLIAAGLFTLITARRWRGSADRRYQAAAATAGAEGSRPHDAIDSWDDLSRGDDPTAEEQHR
ncbi:Trp biosynthesis-associated membrane protein [Microbacterium sp. P07]|uniref:Trp biosynthesis-associated membrane protein n=1 Tax=Microbacterium sp. P07 TaxID=3366952 RepID=UPI00374732D1